MITIIGIDISKRSFQLHGATASGEPVLRRQLTRPKLLGFLAKQPVCRVVMEVCGSAHHWGRMIQEIGHEVRLIPLMYVKPYVKRQKNDANDAGAIVEAAQRPTMRFVAVKTEEEQARSVVFRARALLVHQRTQTINALRGHLAEFGLVAPLGTHNVGRLEEVFAECESQLATGPDRDRQKKRRSGRRAHLSRRRDPAGRRPIRVVGGDRGIHGGAGGTVRRRADKHPVEVDAGQNSLFSSIPHQWYDLFIHSLGVKMGTTRKTITVTKQQDKWIKAQIDGGDFTNDSEYIRDLIRRDQARQFEVDAIRGELIKGEESGQPQAFNGDLFKEQMAAKHARKVR